MTQLNTATIPTVAAKTTSPSAARVKECWDPCSDPSRWDKREEKGGDGRGEWGDRSQSGRR